MGIVGYGVRRFGAAFGFQDHPNIEIVAVSDLISERRGGLMKACRCNKSYESLAVLVKDPKIEAVFVATDTPSHPRTILRGEGILPLFPGSGKPVPSVSEGMPVGRRAGTASPRGVSQYGYLDSQ